MYSAALLSALALSATHALAAQIGAGGLPDGPPSQIQDCKYGGNYNGGWTDGSGTYVDSDSVRYNIGKKCWNDYFVTETTAYDGAWYQIGGNIFCTGADRCVSGVTHSQQQCLTQTDQIGINLAVKSAKMDTTFGFEYSHSWSESNCNTDERTDQCQWTDKGCHTVWGQDRMIKQRGYKRERCNTGDGDFTNCISDWESHYPSGAVNYGCGSKCGDTNDCGNNDGTPCPSKRTVPQNLKA